jgi:hypothetical protein
MAYPSSLGFVGHFIQLVLDLSVQDTPPFSFSPYTTFDHNSISFTLSSEISRAIPISAGVGSSKV